jgi:hypothetical protein
MKFITANYKAIAKAIQEGRTGDVRRELKMISNYVDKKWKEQWQAREDQKKLNAIKALKDIPVGDPVFFIGTAKELFFGQQGQKVRDRKAYMTVKFGEKNWSVHYSMLQPYYPSRDQLNSHQVTQRLTEILHSSSYQDAINRPGR